MNNPTGPLETLVTRAVALVVGFLRSRRGPVIYGKVKDYERGNAAYNWMAKTLPSQGHEELEKLRRAPGSEDNQAGLRKQLTTLLQIAPSAASRLAEIIPLSSEENIDIDKVRHALNVGSDATGAFRHRYNK
jgi:hypothetical protein